MQQMYIKPCKNCSHLFKGIKCALYCDNCKRIMRNVYTQRYRERKKSHTNREYGTKYICENCGFKYILSSGTQKYCPRCGKVNLLMLHRKSANSDEYKQKKYNYKKEQRNKITLQNANRNEVIEIFDGSKIKKMREKKGLNLHEFAELIQQGTATSCFNREKNNNLKIKLSILKKIANALEIDLYTFLANISSVNYQKTTYPLKDHFYAGNKLTMLREQQALTVNKLATMSGFTGSNRLSNYEKTSGAEFDKIKISSIACIANALGYTVIELLQKLET